jgi:hypothetical protein
LQFQVFELEQVLDDAEAAYKVSLSTAARSALIGPVLEAQAFGSAVSNVEVEASIATIVAEAASQIDPLTRNRTQISSVAIAAAIHRKFCSIPPFCSPPIP